MASPYDPSIPGVEPAPSADIQDPRASLVRYTIGGKSYDAVFHRTCKTCTHPARALIEEKVLLNYSYAEIAEMFSEREIDDGHGGFIRTPKLAWSSIMNHYRRKHMPLEHAAARKIAEARAEQMGAEIEGAAQRIVHHRDVVQTIVEQGHDLLQRHQLELDAGDVIRAAKLLADIDERAGTDQIDADAWSNAMQTIFETARRIMPPALWAQFTRELSQNPVLRALEAKEDVVDAEVVG
jgi:hypothetical protein